MIFFDSGYFDPYYNLALEEHLFSVLPEGEQCLMLWQNANTIVVGKNQNTLEEINQEFVEQHDIKVARRLSGGGAVYHDMGNLNFTIITDKEDFERFNFKMFVEPIIKTLAEYGIQAEFTGRNDLVIDGKKFCGNSQYSKGKRVLHHGCIMLDSNLTNVKNALNVKKEKFESKSVKSVISRVTTINANTKEPIKMEDFKQTLKKNVILDDQINEYVVTPEDEMLIALLQTKKYATWNWNYGNTRTFNIRNEKKFPWGLLTVFLQVEKGVIAHIRLQGDYFGTYDVELLEESLKGTPINPELITVLEQANVSDYIQGCSPQELYELIQY